MQDLAGEQVFVGRHVLGGLALGATQPRRLDAAEERRCDRRGDLVLDGENVFELSVVALGPDVGFSLAVDELHGHSDPVHRLAHASLDDVVDPEFAGDLLRLDRLSLVDEHGVARDHQKLTEARQLGDDVLGESVGEKLLLRVAAHVDERQNRDRRLFRALLRRGGRILRGVARARFLAADDDLVDADRPVDVLDLLVAEILVDELEPVADLIAHRRRYADAAGLGDQLEARRDIDAVAEDVVLIDDDVAKIDADPIELGSARPACPGCAAPCAPGNRRRSATPR